MEIVSAREEIPSDIKRQVRQRCGFGCVICGCPIFDYEHIFGYGNTGHDPDKMTLLCPNHHREKTANRMPVDVVVKANASPKNLSGQMSGPYHLWYPAHPLWFPGDYFDVVLGHTTFRYDRAFYAAPFAPLVVDGIPILSVRRVENHVLLSADIRTRNDEVVMAVDDGELRHSTRQWDVEWKGQHLTIRAQARKVVLQIEFQPPNALVIRRGSMWMNGVHWEVRADGGLACNNNDVQMYGATLIDFPQGFYAGPDELMGKAAFSVGNPDRTASEES